MTASSDSTERHPAGHPAAPSDGPTAVAGPGQTPGLSLARFDAFPGRPGPLLLVIADGVGIAPPGPSNAVTEADTPTLDALLASPLSTSLLAHGAAVGLPSDDDMGNSEVGHNALGAGRVFAQGAKLVNHALATGSLFRNPVWTTAVEHGRTHTMHFLGLHSDGNVHASNDQLYQLLERAAEEGVTRARVHILLDGRDVPARSALDYIAQTEQVLQKINEHHASEHADFRIASGGGRMTITMDRYGADWPMVRARLRVPHPRHRSPVPVGHRRGRDDVRRERQRRPVPRRVRRGRRRGHPGRHHARRRLGRALQLPRRPRDRDLARPTRTRRSTASTATPWPAPGRLLLRDAAVRRRRARAEELPGRSARDRADDQRVPVRRGRPELRDQRDPEVRPRHLLLERQPSRASSIPRSRPTSRSRATTCQFDTSAGDEGCARSPTAPSSSSAPAGTGSVGSTSRRRHGGPHRPSRTPPSRRWR